VTNSSVSDSEFEQLELIGAYASNGVLQSGYGRCLVIGRTHLSYTTPPAKNLSEICVPPPAPPSRPGGVGGVGITMPSETKTIPRWFAGECKKITTERDFGFIEIEICVRNSLSGVEIMLTELSSLPPGVTAPSVPNGIKVYKYIKIDTQNITDADISRVTFRARVPKSWMNVTGGHKIRLQRWDGTWEVLRTIRVSEDAVWMYFEINNTRLSLYALTGEPPACPTCPAPSGWSECGGVVINQQGHGNQTRTEYVCNESTYWECEPVVAYKPCLFCPPLPEPSPWTECDRGLQTRIEYYCSEATNFTLRPRTAQQRCCLPCPEPSEWSECINGTQSRVEYTCGSETNYECQKRVVSRDCVVPIPVEVDFRWLVLIPIIGLVLASGWYLKPRIGPWWQRYKRHRAAELRRKRKEEERRKRAERIRKAREKAERERQERLERLRKLREERRKREEEKREEEHKEAVRPIIKPAKKPSLLERLRRKPVPKPEIEKMPETETLKPALPKVEEREEIKEAVPEKLKIRKCSICGKPLDFVLWCEKCGKDVCITHAHRVGGKLLCEKCLGLRRAKRSR
jgi:PGF-pre-PGF domain-containing protein